MFDIGISNSILNAIQHKKSLWFPISGVILIFFHFFVGLSVITLTYYYVFLLVFSLLPLLVLTSVLFKSKKHIFT